MFICPERESERASEQTGEGQRDRDRKNLCAVSAEPAPGLDLTN